MNPAQCYELLSPDNIRIAARVLQALDELAEFTYLEKHHKDLTKELGAPSESEISSFTEQAKATFPALLLAANGYGYRMLLTHVHNAFIAVGLPNEAQIFLAARLPSV